MTEAGLTVYTFTKFGDGRVVADLLVSHIFQRYQSKILKLLIWAIVGNKGVENQLRPKVFISCYRRLSILVVSYYYDGYDGSYSLLKHVWPLGNGL